MSCTSIPAPTIYVDRTLPAYFKPGRVLSERDCVELHDLMDRSSSHNRRLYVEISRLPTELGQTPLSRIIHGVRRLLARGKLRWLATCIGSGCADVHRGGIMLR